ncbi:hypothetical protein [Pseudomonas sp. Irchel 3E13]|uniref:hypothetical protein n=1 Tax=Pseudomonas sp. Irchel 3E13 TaxID=2008975 RepID=UPI000BA4520F|nr:hypothetical protein [Pseudomonas sp. Irchel 3E13]
MTTTPKPPKPAPPAPALLAGPVNVTFELSEAVAALNAYRQALHASIHAPGDASPEALEVLHQEMCKSAIFLASVVGAQVRHQRGELITD